MKKIQLLLLVLAILSCFVGFYLAVRFEELPKDAKVRNIEINEYSVQFFITEDDKLYVGGINRDSMGLFDKTGFRWGFLYAIRGFLGRTNNPVLFAENVAQVFEATDGATDKGFLYTDLNGTLYYFGSATKGNSVKIAEDVKGATACNRTIFYVTSFGDLYQKFLDGTDAVIIGKNVADVYTNGSAIRIVDSTGEVYQIDTRSPSCQTYNTQGGSVVKAVRNDYNSTCVLTEDGNLTFRQWETGITAGEEASLFSPNALVLLTDMNFNRLCWMDQEGILYIAHWSGNKANVTEVSHLDKAEVIDIAVDHDDIYILFSDGTYRRIAHKT